MSAMRTLATWALSGLAIACATTTLHAQQSAAFSFAITLSDRAAKTLVASNEGITVFASYYGDPKEGAEKHADEMGQLNLGVEEFELPGRPGLAEVKGVDFERGKLKWLAGPVMVNVNIFSSRKSGPDNILSCDLIDGELDAVLRKPVSVHCSLIEEQRQTDLKP